MGDAEIHIHPFVEAVKVNLSDIPNDTIITTVKLNRKNCSADESAMVRKEGEVVQDIILRLRNVETGELELQLLWIVPCPVLQAYRPTYVFLQKLQ